MLTMGHGLGDYESWIGQRWIIYASQQLQSFDDESQAGDKRSWTSNDGSPAGNNGSRARGDGLCVGVYVYACTHPNASRVYKGRQISFRQTTLFLLFLLPNMSSRPTTSVCNILSTRHDDKPVVKSIL